MARAREEFESHDEEQFEAHTEAGELQAQIETVRHGIAAVDMRSEFSDDRLLGAAAAASGPAAVEPSGSAGAGPEVATGSPARSLSRSSNSGGSNRPAPTSDVQDAGGMVRLDLSHLQKLGVATAGQQMALAQEAWHDPRTMLPADPGTGTESVPSGGTQAQGPPATGFVEQR